MILFDTVKVSQIFLSVIDGPIPFWSVLVFYEDKLNEAKHAVPVEEIILTLSEENLYEALRKWRNDQATKENIPQPAHFLKKIVVYAYIVSSNIIEESKSKIKRGETKCKITINRMKN